MTIPEISGAAKAFNEIRGGEERGAWERMRLHAAMILQALCSNPIDPKKILPLPWDKEEEERKAPEMTREQRKQRYLYYKKHGKWPTQP